MPVDKISVPLYVCVPDREPALLTDSHYKLDILVDTQELLNTSHHRIGFECVCVFLASGYKWVTIIHEIPISSAQLMTSVHTLGHSSTTPLVPLKRGLFHMRRFQRVRSILDRTPWQLLGGQVHNLGSFPCHNIVEFAGEGQACVCPPSLNYRQL